MKKVYFLKSCSTCVKILKAINLPEEFVLQDIKTDGISEKQLEEMYRLSGSYEALFSKRAQLYKQRDLKNKNLSEKDFKKYILEHYTFLSRPVIIFNDQVFIGNSPKMVEAAKQAIHAD